MKPSGSTVSAGAGSKRHSGAFARLGLEKSGSRYMGSFLNRGSTGSERTPGGGDPSQTGAEGQGRRGRGRRARPTEGAGWRGGASGRPPQRLYVRPEGSGDPSPGLRPKADALGKRPPPRCGLEGRETPARQERPARAATAHGGAKARHRGYG